MPAALMIKEIAVAIQEKAASSIPEFKNLDTGKGSLSPQKNELSPLKNEIPEFSNKGVPGDSGDIKDLTLINKDVPDFHARTPQAVDNVVPHDKSPEDTSKEIKDTPENTHKESHQHDLPSEKTEANGKEGAEANNEVKPENPSPQNDKGDIPPLEKSKIDSSDLQEASPIDPLKETNEKHVIHSDVQETEKLGGAYKDLPSQEGTQKHHIPADSATDIPYRDGPCILMDTKDHAQTASFGNSRESQEYREKQKELYEQGKLREAYEMDKEDIQSKFGDKYDKPLAQVEEYINEITNEQKEKLV